MRKAADEGGRAESKRPRVAAAGAAAAGGTSGGDKRRLRLAVVCSSNQNRSMEAHNFLKRKGFNISSYGSGQHVKIPGPSVDQPNVYEFGTPYDEIYTDLETKDRDRYEAMGMLQMVDRNRKIKLAPERFQETDRKFDVIITCEGRVFDQVTQGLEDREQESFEPVHVCNFEIKDNHESATLGALQIVNLCEMLEDVDDLDDKIDDVLQKFEEKNKEWPILHSVNFY